MLQYSVSMPILQLAYSPAFHVRWILWCSLQTKGWNECRVVGGAATVSVLHPLSPEYDTLLSELTWHNSNIISFELFFSKIPFKCKIMYLGLRGFLLLWRERRDRDRERLKRGKDKERGGRRERKKWQEKTSGSRQQLIDLMSIKDLIPYSLLLLAVANWEMCCYWLLVNWSHDVNWQLS